MKRDQKARPSYAVEGVDRALRIATMLQLEGPMTLTEVATRLQVAPSTAHRLLATLVYRDFASQDESRAYRAGPLLQLGPAMSSEGGRLRRTALPHLQHLVDSVQESTNLVVRAGTAARVIASVECERPFRVGTREGMSYPLHELSAGMLILAELPFDQLEKVYAGADHQPEWAGLRRQLQRLRRQGFAVNDGKAERGVVGVSCLIRHPHGAPAAALSITLPKARFQRNDLSTLVARLRSTAERVGFDLRS